MLSTSQEATGEADPFVDEVLYSSSSVEDTVVLQSGRDNATYYRYLIIDDYDDSPENWSQPGFNDSGGDEVKDGPIFLTKKIEKLLEK